MGSYSVLPLMETYSLSTGHAFKKSDHICDHCHIGLRNTKGTSISFKKRRGKRKRKKKLSKAQLELNSDDMECQSINEAGVDNSSEINDAHLDQYDGSSYVQDSNATSTNVTSNILSQSQGSSYQSTQQSNTQRSQDNNYRQKVKLSIKSTIKTNRCCFICKKTKSRMEIPRKAIIDVWIQKRIYIFDDNRCCSDHLDENSLFRTESLATIKAYRNETELTVEKVMEFINILTTQDKGNMQLDFGENSTFTSEDFQMLTGLERKNFDNLFKHCTGLRDSVNRSPRNALAIFLMKMRLNLPQAVLAILFGIDSQMKISKIIESVRKALENNFVGKNLGYDHITREDCLKGQTGMIKKLFSASDNDVFLITDATYLYIQKFSDFEQQKKSYCNHKHRNLLKPLMVVLPNMYILEVEGLYFSDSKNNDAGILNSILADENSKLSQFLEESDCFVVDRGFRDSIAYLDQKNVRSVMPNLLKKNQKQFTTSEANQSRRVTLVRWVVEAVNGRVKHKYPFFDSVIPATYVPKLNSLFRIVCAIINKYSPVLCNDSEEDLAIAEAALSRMEKENELQREVELLQLEKKVACWTLASPTEPSDFPKLDEKTLKNIVLGKHQLKLARRYTDFHMECDSSYKFFFHKEVPNLIRAKLESRFTKGHCHQLWIRYDPEKANEDSIVSFYCKCKSGARTVSCCSHIASILWYLGLGRHDGQAMKKHRNLCSNILDAAARLHENLDTMHEDYNIE